MKNLPLRFLKSSKLFEFLMIFIGITLSMQFNNWNEERKLKQLEIELISDLYLDVLQDSIELNNCVVNHQKYFIDPLSLLDTSLKVVEPIDYSKLAKPLKITIGGNYMSMNMGAYECFKHQGISLMKNSQLKIKLFEYYEAGLNWIKSNQKVQNDFGDNYMIPLCVKYADSKLFLPFESYIKMRKDEKAKLLISFWLGTYEKNMQLHKDLIPLLNDLKQEMEKELIANGIDPKQILKEAIKF